MSIAPTRISGAARSTQLDQDWSTAMKDPKRKIPLALTDELKTKDPEAHKLLSSLSPEQLTALKAADKDKSGSLSLTEVVEWQGQHVWGVIAQPLGFLLFVTVLAYMSYRNVWAEKTGH